MLNWIKVPNSNNNDYYEQARFKLTWNINLALVFTLLLLTIIFVFIEPKFVLHYSIGVAMTSLSAIYMFIIRSYRTTAIFLCIVAYLLVSSSVWFIPNAVHYIEPFWILIISLYAYFALGKLWGLIFLLGNIVTTASYFILLLNDNILSIEKLTLAQTITMGMEFTLCSLLLGYIVHQFISTNSNAERQVKKANEEVNREKMIVERQDKEKTILLQEIHHRVKNNLQVITSLLRMQSSKIISEEAQMNFQDAINRIMTMSLIHQKMYEKDNLGQVNLDDYISSLVEDLIESGDSKNTIQFKVQTEINQVGSKSIVPLALLITELISNTIKHAFEGSEVSPRIEISIYDNAEQGIFTLDYFDSGRWKESVKDSFGIELMETLVEQMEGSFTRTTGDSGTKYHFTLMKLENA